MGGICRPTRRRYASRFDSPACAPASRAGQVEHLHCESCWFFFLFGDSAPGAKDHPACHVAPSTSAGVIRQRWETPSATLTGSAGRAANTQANLHQSPGFLAVRRRLTSSPSRQPKDKLSSTAAATTIDPQACRRCGQICDQLFAGTNPRKAQQTAGLPPGPSPTYLDSSPCGPDLTSSRPSCNHI